MGVNSPVPEAKGGDSLQTRKILWKVKQIMVGNNKPGGFVEYYDR
jgi:hypothetical protein